MIIKHVGKSAETVAQFAIALIQGHAQDQAKSDQMDVADAFHKLMRHLYRQSTRGHIAYIYLHLAFFKLLIMFR